MTDESPSAALHAPATLRNREPILAVLRRVLPEQGLLLEIASGSGEHAVHFASALPGLAWQPSDPDPQALASIAAHRDGARLENLLAPMALDAAAPDWPIDRADAVLTINMIHISPWAATLGLLAGAARVLAPGAPLVLYGPYREAGQPLAPSNAAFDGDLRARNPDWGLRDLDDLRDVAASRGLAFAERLEMPANNLVLVFTRRR